MRRFLGSSWRMSRSSHSCDACLRKKARTDFRSSFGKSRSVMYADIISSFSLAVGGVERPRKKSSALDQSAAQREEEAETSPREGVGGAPVRRL